MSLAEGLLLDSLYDPPVVKQEIFIANRSDSSPGAGTFLNPYSAANFDSIMGSIATGSCVRLGPGTFSTAGGFSLADSVRIVGSGRDVTTVQLTGSGYVFGGASPPSRTGVEISDLCIDCHQTGGAISITGINNVFRTLRIINFAPNPAAARTIVLLAKSVGSPSSNIARNCVLDDCIFESSGTFTGSYVVTLVQLVGDSSGGIYAHQFCVVRRCVFDGGTVSNLFTGIDAGLGRGFIAEENQFFNLNTGIALNDAPAVDLIFWNNAFNIVRNGISLSRTSSASPQVGRAILMENEFNLERNTGGADATAISILGSSTNQNFAQVIIRKKVIAGDPAGTGTNTLKGIQVKNVANAIVENNMINDCDGHAGDALGYAACTTFKSFNNQDTSGFLLRAYDLTNARYLMELQDFTEDALIGF